MSVERGWQRSLSVARTAWDERRQLERDRDGREWREGGDIGGEGWRVEGMV